MNRVEEIEKEFTGQLKKDYPNFKPGDIIKVFYKVRDKEKIRIHPIEDVVIKIQGAQCRKSFTLRRLSFGEMYEVTFPYYSPNIDKIDLSKASKRRPRRARIYYLRGRKGKKAFIA